MTIYVPIVSPPTPAPSPGPSAIVVAPQPLLHPDALSFSSLTAYPDSDPAHLSRREFACLPTSSLRTRYLASLLSDCTPSELLFISTSIAPLLKRDFLADLPAEIALHVLHFVDDTRSLARVSQVSRTWRHLVMDDSIWKRMCTLYRFDTVPRVISNTLDDEDDDDEPLEEMEKFAILPMDPALQWFATRKRLARRAEKQKQAAAAFHAISFSSPISSPLLDSLSYHQQFKYSYITMMNWRLGGHLLRTHRLPLSPSSQATITNTNATGNGNGNPHAHAGHPEASGVVTSAALDGEWIVVGLATCRIHVFSARTGVLSRTLVGHELGVWAVCLVSRGGTWGGSTEASVVGEDEGGGNGERDEGRDGDEDEEAAATEKQTSLEDMTLDKLAEMLEEAKMDAWENGPATGTDPLGGLDHLVPPRLRTALGLDLKHGKRQAKAGAKGGGDGGAKGPGKRSDLCSASEGWGQPNALVVSGGCDKVLRVWDVKTGHCIYVLHGHTATIRCTKVLHNRPVAVTGSRDATLRVWDVQRGRLLRVLRGHSNSVRCMDVCGNKVVSGSYDTTCRLWDIDTGECLHVLRGHFHQIYCVAFDGERIASGGLDTMVRVWSAETGQCLALLQGHSALVCQLQLARHVLLTGGSDGRVIAFSLATYAPTHRLAAHDSSVTALQLVGCGGNGANSSGEADADADADGRFLVTGGNDGRVRLFEAATGRYIRELSERSESVWKVVCGKETCAVMCRRGGRTVMEVWGFGPRG